MLSAVSRLGEIIGGRYELLEVIGEGGMGTVFKARHTLSEHLVALKLLSDLKLLGDSTRSLERFKREASASARIGHPGLVQVLDAGTDSPHGGLFIAMELLEGQTLKERFATGDISMREKIKWLVELLEPLEALHAAGFVHRDLKPDNVFIARGSDGTEHVKLLDFGLAREIGVETATLTGTAFGTPHYMAPEQSMSAKDVTSAADVWAAGVMLYEVLAGTKPFTGETPNAIIVASCTSGYHPLSEAVLSRELVSIVDACLAKHPADRLQTAGALRSALVHALQAAPELDALPRGSATGHALGAVNSAGRAPGTVDARRTTASLNAETLELPLTETQPQRSPPSDPPPAQLGAPAANSATSKRGIAAVLAVFLGGGASLWWSIQDHAASSAVEASSRPARSVASSTATSAVPPPEQVPTRAGSAAPAPSILGSSRAQQPSSGSARPSAAAAPTAAHHPPAPQPSAPVDDDPGYLEDWKAH